MAYFALRLGQYDAALSCAERALAIGRAFDDAGLTAKALTAVGFGLAATDHPARALVAYEEASAVARGKSDSDSLSGALNGMAEIHRAAGDFAEAQVLYEEAIALHRTQGNPRGIAVTLGNLACLLIEAGELDRARAALAESQALALAIGSKGTVECQLDFVAAFAAATASHSIAARIHGAALARMHDSGTRSEPVDEAFTSGWIARSREAMGSAAFDAAEAEGKALSYEAAVAEMNRWLGRPA
jgi:tetratricopeptide (TPR) repeat protein